MTQDQGMKTDAIMSVSQGPNASLVQRETLTTMRGIIRDQQEITHDPNAQRDLSAQIESTIDLVLSVQIGQNVLKDQEETRRNHQVDVMLPRLAGMQPLSRQLQASIRNGQH